MNAQRGVIYLLTGPSHAARLVVSLWSLRKHYNGPVTIYTTHPRSHEVGQQCASDHRLSAEHRVYEQVRIRRNSSFLTKLALLPDVPYETAIYLDADTLITGNIDELHEQLMLHDFVATRFSNWRSDGRLIRKRIEQWRNIRQKTYDTSWFNQLIDAAIKPHPAVNGGVFAFRRTSAILRPWNELALVGWKTFICDEIALQLLLPQYQFQVLDCRYNCSPSRAFDTPDVRIWHFHGEKHVANERAQGLWVPVYQECINEDVAGIAAWTPLEDPHLAHFLEMRELP